MVVIELKDKDAEAFRVFLEHRAFFDVLIDNDIHKMSNGNALLSFDSVGQLRKVKLEQTVFRT